MLSTEVIQNSAKECAAHAHNFIGMRTRTYVRYAGALQLEITAKFVSFPWNGVSSSVGRRVVPK